MADVDWSRPDYSAVYTERAERLQRLRSDPAILPGLLDYYKERPADFVNDWGMTFDPRNAEIGVPTTVPFLLFPKQRQFLDWLHDRWRNREDGLAEKSRDMGVSWLCVAFGVWMWRFHPGTVIGFGSRKEEYVDNIGDPKSLFWKVRQFIELLPAELRPRGYVTEKHAPFMRIQNPENGAAIVGEAGDNIGRGNRTSIYFKDESAFYPRPEAIDAALSQTSNCKIDVSTPNGAGNPFYKKRKSGKIKVFTFHWRDDPRKDEAWYAAQAEKLDPVILAQEVDIDYEASVTDAFIGGDLVRAAADLGPAQVIGMGPVKWGLDVARFGDDKSVLTRRRGRLVYQVEDWPQIDTMALADAVWNRCKELWFADSDLKPAQIAVDTIGVGAGVYDRLVQYQKQNAARVGVQLVAVNSSIRVEDGVNYNKRAKMWDDMREWLKDTPCSIPVSSALVAELPALKYYYRNGLRLIESKEDAKKRGIKSPDYADSLALTFAEPVKSPPKPLKFASEF